jgi:hypothetical protein
VKRVLLWILASLCLSGCVNTHPLVGLWKTVDGKGHESVLIFKNDQTFEARSRGETLPGTWKLNEDVQPNQLELVFEEPPTILTIAKLEGDQFLIEPREENAELPKQFTKNAQKYRRQ